MNSKTTVYWFLLPTILQCILHHNHSLHGKQQQTKMPFCRNPKTFVVKNYVHKAFPVFVLSTWKSLQFYANFPTSSQNQQGPRHLFHLKRLNNYLQLKSNTVCYTTMSPVCICLKKSTTQSSVQTEYDNCAYLQQFLVILKKKSQFL